MLDLGSDQHQRSCDAGASTVCFMVCSGELSSASGCAVSTGISVIFGANAVCRYFSYKGKSSSPKGPTADPAEAVEEWLDWETGTLAPAERALAASKEAGVSVPTEALAVLKHLEDKLTGTWLLEGVRCSTVCWNFQSCFAKKSTVGCLEHSTVERRCHCSLGSAVWFQPQLSVTLEWKCLLLFYQTGAVLLMGRVVRAALLCPIALTLCFNVSSMP